MTTNSNHNPSFRLTRLYRKQSQQGRTYFTGRLAGARITLLKAKDTADDGGEIWDLLIAEAPPPKQRQDAQDGAQRQERQPAAEDARRDYQRPTGQRQASDDDTIPF